MERKQFEMSQEDFDKLIKACQPVPYMVFNGVAPRSPQENANAAWKVLGDKMGFDYMTVKAIDGKDQKFFTAIPTDKGKQDE